MNLTYSNPYFHEFSIGFNSCFVIIPVALILCFLLGYLPAKKKQKEALRIGINFSKFAIPPIIGVLLARLFVKECGCGVLQLLNNGAVMESEACYTLILAILAVVVLVMTIILLPIVAMRGGKAVRRKILRRRKKNLG